MFMELTPFVMLIIGPAKSLEFTSELFSGPQSRINWRQLTKGMGDFLPGAENSVPFFNHRVGDCCDK